MQFDDIPLDEQMKKRLISLGIWVKQPISRQEALVLISETLLQELCRTWKELFPDCRLKRLAMSQEELTRWVKDGVIE